MPSESSGPWFMHDHIASPQLFSVRESAWPCHNLVPLRLAEHSSIIPSSSYGIVILYIIMIVFLFYFLVGGFYWPTNLLGGIQGTLSESQPQLHGVGFPNLFGGFFQPPGPGTSAAQCCFLSSKNGYAQVVVRVILAAGAVSTLGAMLHVMGICTPPGWLSPGRQPPSLKIAGCSLLAAEHPYKTSAQLKPFFGILMIPQFPNTCYKSGTVWHWGGNHRWHERSYQALYKTLVLSVPLRPVHRQRTMETS